MSSSDIFKFLNSNGREFLILGSSLLALGLVLYLASPPQMDVNKDFEEMRRQRAEKVEEESKDSSWTDLGKDPGTHRPQTDTITVNSRKLPENDFPSHPPQITTSGEVESFGKMMVKAAGALSPLSASRSDEDRESKAEGKGSSEFVEREGMRGEHLSPRELLEAMDDPSRRALRDVAANRYGLLTSVPVRKSTRELSLEDSLVDLLPAIQSSYKRAQKSDQLVNFPTTHDFISGPGGVTFVIRLAAQLLKKPTRTDVNPNPFMPPFRDPDLVVCDPLPSPFSSHRLLLNKYNVLPEHVILCPVHFEHQNRSALSKQDLLATSLVLKAYTPGQPTGGKEGKPENSAEGDLKGSPGHKLRGMGTGGGRRGALAFYNHGPMSGFSQLHKHIQVVPLPVAPHCAALPIDPWLIPEKLKPLPVNATHSVAEAQVLAMFLRMDVPFVNAVALLGSRDEPRYRSVTPATPVHTSLTADLLTKLLGSVGCDWEEQSSFNLLWTQHWAMAVPRRRDAFTTLPVNRSSSNLLSSRGHLSVRAPSPASPCSKGTPGSCESHMSSNAQPPPPSIQSPQSKESERNSRPEKLAVRTAPSEGVKIEINAMGFTGSFFVKTQTAADVIRTMGPLQVLTKVGFPFNRLNHSSTSPAPEPNTPVATPTGGKTKKKERKRQVQ